MNNVEFIVEVLEWCKNHLQREYHEDWIDVYTLPDDSTLVYNATNKTAEWDSLTWENVPDVM